MKIKMIISKSAYHTILNIVYSVSNNPIQFVYNNRHVKKIIIFAYKNILNFINFRYFVGNIILKGIFY